MYIGKLGDGSSQDDGVYVLLKEVMDNAVDEFMMGYGKKIDVSITGQGGKGSRLWPWHSSWKGAGCSFQDEYRRKIRFQGISRNLSVLTVSV